MKLINLENWNFMRAIRLIAGIYFLIGGIIKVDVLSIVLGSILLIQVVFNLGCCGTNGCSTNPKINSNKEITDIEFEEIK